MTGAMYAAIGGLKTHMSNLNVIGNNIANVNTTAYKAQRMIFQESLYVTSKAGSDGTATRGGNTPSQVGYGVKVGSIDLSMAPGTYNPTGNALDCMIDGDGFFMVGDKDIVMNSGDALNRPKFTRAGTFRVDARGYVVDNQNSVVYGFQMVYNPDYVKGASEETILAAKQEDPPRNIEDKLILSTTLVPLRVPLAAVEPTEANGGIDAQGNHLWEAGDPVYDVLGGAIEGSTERRNLSLANAAYYDTETGAFADGNAIPAGANTVTGREGEFSAENFINVNGGAIPNLNDTVAGLEGLSVNENGAIIGTAGNGDTVVVGYIAIAQVTAPDGVTHIGGPYYKAQEGSGAVSVGIAGGLLDAGVYLNNATTSEELNYTPELRNLLNQMKGVKIQGSGLEASTADVATEFANMIVTQRGYQANTRIVTVTDSMLEELVNMKR